jgi:hypothetical protein
MERWMTITSCAAILALASAHGGETDSSPSQIVIVSHPQALRLTKHPTLPVLYLGCAYAPESKNLVTYRLNPDGSLMANSQRAHDDFLTDDRKKPAPEYRLLRPIVLAEARVLLLAAWPYDGRRFNATSHAQHLAAVALDDEGQPLRSLETFRTTYRKSTPFTMHYDSSTRRLFLTYDNGQFGWCEVRTDGVPSDRFHALSAWEHFYYYTLWPAAQRFYVAGKELRVCKLAADGRRMDFAQSAACGQGSFANIELSTALRKLYVLDGPSNETVTVFPLTHDGRLTGVPRRFHIGQTDLLRFDFKGSRMICMTSAGSVRVFPLDAEGFPVGDPQALRLNCGAIRDAIVDESTGRVYVAAK